MPACICRHTYEHSFHNTNVYWSSKHSTRMCNRCYQFSYGAMLMLSWMPVICPILTFWSTDRTNTLSYWYQKNIVGTIRKPMHEFLRITHQVMWTGFARWHLKRFWQVSPMVDKSFVGTYLSSWKLFLVCPPVVRSVQLIGQNDD